MFLNWYIHSLDSKNRLTLPAKFRDRLALGVVIALHPSDRCLLLFPQAKWDELAEKIEGLALFNPTAAALRRSLFGTAEDLKLDGQGRIVINQFLREKAAILEEVRVTGASTFLELWNPELWEEHVEKPLRNGEVRPSLFADLGI